MKLRTLALVLGGLVGCSTIYSINDTASNIVLRDQPGLEYVATSDKPKPIRKAAANIVNAPIIFLDEVQDAFAQAIEDSWEEYGSFLVDEHLQDFVDRGCSPEMDSEFNTLPSP